MIPAFRRLPVFSVAALLIFASATAAKSAAAAPAQPPASPPGPPMTFFVAKGEPNACGPGCSEWIAAEGTIDSGAPKRLRAFLKGLGKRKLPMFLHSPGGLGPASLEMGRMLRERQMTAGVSKTIPRTCAPAGDACQASKRSGEVLEADLRNVAGCASACVFVLIGAEVRQVPPGARVGVHAPKIRGVDTDGRQRAYVNARNGRYLREMQIGEGLLDLITSVPNERVHYLSRQQIAEFGIDTSEFRESHWTAVDEQSQPFSVLKIVVEAKAKQRKEYQTNIIRLSCAGPGRVRLSHFHSLAPDQTGTTGAVELAADDKKLSFSKAASIARVDAMETGGLYEIRAAQGDALGFLEADATRDHIDIIESVSADGVTSLRIVRLSVSGLPQALEQLKAACRERMISDGPGIRFLDVSDAPAVKFLGRPR
jgi:hypothetical protein